MMLLVNMKHQETNTLLILEQADLTSGIHDKLTSRMHTEKTVYFLGRMYWVMVLTCSFLIYLQEKWVSVLMGLK